MRSLQLFHICVNLGFEGDYCNRKGQKSFGCWPAVAFEGGGCSRENHSSFGHWPVVALAQVWMENREGKSPALDRWVQVGWMGDM